MRSPLGSPSSDTSSRSEWFRQSVLFWSSKSESENEISESHVVLKTTSAENTTTVPEKNQLTNKSTDSDKYQEKTNVDVDKKGIIFDASDLLRQVEELEKCFSPDAYPQPVTEERNSHDISPHLTLEFPSGSSIKNNPLYVQAERNYSMQHQSLIRKRDDNLKPLNKKMDKSYESSLEDVEMLLNIVEAAVLSDEKCSTDYTKDIKPDCKGLDNAFYSEVKIETISTDDCDQYKTKEGDFQKQNIFNNKIGKSKSEINKKVITNNKSCEENNTTYQVVNEINKNSDPSFTKHETDIEVSDNTDHRIVESIQKVQDTLFEISREIHCSSNSKYVRDPNEVLRNILSGIKPPVESDSSTCVTKGSACVTKGNQQDCVEKLAKNNDMAACPDFYDTNLTTEELFEESERFHLKSEEFLKRIDNLLVEEKKAGKAKRKDHFISSKNLQKLNQLERNDSGLHSTSSDSNSPHHSPRATRKPNHNNRPETLHMESGTHETIWESLREFDDVFNEDSDFSSDWSPVSTLGSVASTRTRSNSLPRTHTHRDGYLRDTRYSSGNMSDSNILRNSRMYTEKELRAIRKFLMLTSHCMERPNGKTDPLQSVDDLALLPNIKFALDQQSKELLEQRAKQEEFLQQLGDLLLQIVSLREEHSTVRTKQAKALALLKKQLDLTKKNQSKAHNEVLHQVNEITERLNSSLSIDETSTSVTPVSLASTPRLSTPRDQIRNHGQIIWKVTDVMKKLTRIKAGLLDGAVVSQPFHTNEYGYKMNGWIYLNGRGRAVGKFISVYVCVLVGEYDAILPWPIKPSYKLTLIDQKADTSKRHDHVKIRHVVDIAGKGASLISQNGGITRPGDGTKALIVGFDDFIAHEKLLERRYLADDTLFLQIEAEVS